MYVKSDVKKLLQDKICEVTFEKKDGSERVMKCTLKASELPPVEIKEDADTKQRAENPDVLAVWDMEAKGWRSFRLDSVKKVLVEG